MPTVRFYWQCVVHAWRGCWTSANERAGLLGAGIFWVLLWISSNRLAERQLIEAPITYWGVAGFSLASAVASVSLTFLVIFAARLIVAPASLYYDLQKSIPLAPKSDMSISLHDGLAYEADLKDCVGNDLPAAMAFCLRVENIGGKFLQKCQITFGVPNQFHYPVSSHFDLRHGEYRDIPFLRVKDEVNSRAFVYFLRNADGKFSPMGRVGYRGREFMKSKRYRPILLLSR
jgi:hypothetical protein